MSTDIIKIGLDFHGVITCRPEFFAEFTHQAVNAGCEIYIITGGPLKKVKEFLKKHGFVYTDIFAIMDYYANIGKVEYLDNGDFHVADELWNSAKAEYCAKNKIDVHIDDSCRYVCRFITPYCHYENEKCCCVTQNGKVVDLSGNAAVALNEIIKFIKEK